MQNLTLLVEHPVGSEDAALPQVGQHWIEEHVAHLERIDVEAVKQIPTPGRLETPLFELHLDVVTSHIWQQCRVSVEVQEGKQPQEETKNKLHHVNDSKDRAQLWVHLQETVRHG